MKKGFDSKLYMEKQSEHILERISKFDKLYLEFGGKLFDDLHAARVLPGFDKAAKIKLLQKLKDKAELIICINANDIEKNKTRADFGITYGAEVERLIDNISATGVYINSVCISLYSGQPVVDAYCRKLENRGIKVHIHTATKGYPNDYDTILSDEGYGANDFIETTRPLVVVTAPGPGSGKLALCLNQLYHEFKRGVKAGYAKFETFPIWNLPLEHPVNIAYEAATADLQDVNQIDSFHLAAYGIPTVNYNRDLAVFPVVRTILTRITGSEDVYQSPTDMGVNMAGYAIVNDEVCRKASQMETIRRYYKALCDVKLGQTGEATVSRLEYLMSRMGIKPSDREVIGAALEKSEAHDGDAAMAIQLDDGKIVTGRQTDLLSASAACVFNAVKELADIPDDLKLISPYVIGPILDLKNKVLHQKYNTLSLEEALLSLSICAATDVKAARAMDCLKKLQGCEAHSSRMLGKSDEAPLKQMGVNITSEPVFADNNLFSF